MASISQAGYGSKIENHEFLVTKVETYPKFNPVPEPVKVANYKPFLASVKVRVSDYNKLLKTENDAINVVADRFIQLDDITRKIRNLLLEIFGSGETYDDYNEIIDLITGDNVTKNFLKRKKELAANPPPEGAPVEDFQSVSQQDRGSLIAKFTALVDSLESDPKYLTNDPELEIAVLRTFITSVNTDLNLLAQIEGNIAQIRTEIRQPLRRTGWPTFPCRACQN